MNDEVVLQNASEIIEKFGGIRPMAKKLRVPVTTVQGWKVRDAIPATRREEMIEAAHIYRIDLSNFAWAASNTNTAPAPAVSAPDINEVIIIPAKQVVEEKSEPMSEAEKKIPPLSAVPPISFSARASAPEQPKPAAEQTQTINSIHDLPTIDMKQVHRTSMRTALITAAAVSVVVGGMTGLLLRPKAPSPQGGQAAQLSADDAKKLAMVPALDTRLQKLETTPQTSLATELATRLGSLMGWLGYSDADAQQMGLSTLAGRVTALEQKIDALRQIAQSGGALGGQNNADLQSLFGALNARLDSAQPALSAAKAGGETAASTLEGMTKEDATAAGLLLGLVQLRSASERQTPFADDLAMMKKLAGSRDPKLAQSLDKLAPYAEKGVLSPSTLKTQLAGLATDVALSAAKGEDMNIKDKALSRFKDFFSLKHNGQDVLSEQSPQQKAIETAKTQLDAGDVAAAVATLQAVKDPKAQQALSPFIQQANGLVLAQQVQSQIVTLVRSMVNNTASGSPVVGVGNIGPAAATGTTTAAPAPTPANVTATPSGAAGGMPAIAPNNTITAPAPTLQ